MNDTTRLEVRPEVTDFVERVRARLADLSEDERDELLGGLEADLTELVADGGSVQELGDPRAYADELRAAAGLDRPRVRSPKVRRPRRPVGEVVTDALDRSRGRWEALMTSRAGVAGGWEVVRTLRPAWWLLRAWTAAQLVDASLGGWETPTLVPRLGDDVTGLLLLLAACAVSVLIGLGRLWPAASVQRSVTARVVLLALNLFAVGALVAVVDDFPSASYLHEQNHPCAVGGCGPYVPSDGLVHDGKPVRNVFAYDADGNALEGVQLYDQQGRPLDLGYGVVSRMRYGTGWAALYPWRDQEGRRWNVYPLPVRTDNGWGLKKDAWVSSNPPFLPQPPAVAVPPAFLPLPDATAPGTVPGEGATEGGADEPGPGDGATRDRGRRSSR